MIVKIRITTPRNEVSNNLLTCSELMTELITCSVYSLNCSELTEILIEQNVILLQDNLFEICFRNFFNFTLQDREGVLVRLSLIFTTGVVTPVCL